MAEQGSYPLNGRTLQSTDTCTGVVTGQTADIPLSNLAAFLAIGGLPDINQHGVLVNEITSVGVVPPGTSGLPLLSGGTVSDPAYGVLSISGGGTGSTTASGALMALGGMPVLNSIASLQALPPAGNASAFVTGYYTGGDGGGGSYSYNASTPQGSANGGSIIAAEGGIGCWVLDRQSAFLSIKQFGAKVDGLTDDTAAINAADAAATSAGISLWFDGGTTRVSNLGITRNGCSWKGMGQQASIVKALAQTWTTGQPNLVTCTAKSFFTTVDIGFDVSAATFPAGVGNPGNIYTMLAFTNCNQWVVKNCAFTGIQVQIIALAVNGGNQWQIVENYFNMPTPSSGFNQSINASTAAGAISGFMIARNTSIGCAFDTSGSNGLILGNYIYGWKFGSGITLGGVAGATSTSNVIIGNQCLFGAGEDINNTFPSGIECWEAYDLIQGNFCAFNSGHGISIGAIATNVLGNTCLNNGQNTGQVSSGIIAFGLSASSATRCVVKGNLCIDTQGSPTQSYGYSEFQSGGSITLMDISDNSFSGNKLGTTLLVGSKVSFRGPQLFGTTTANPGAVSTGTTSIQGPYGIPDAALGDTVRVGFAADNQGCVFSGYVSSPGNVSVAISNLTGGTKTFGSTTLNIWIEKPAGYASLS